ncbi:hypothetical protein Tco_0302676 [Tanacetum coccineum]
MKMCVLCKITSKPFSTTVSHPPLHAIQLFDLVPYTDSDYAGASLDRKSTTGEDPLAISWQCKKQTMVANSTIEAEYVADSSCCGQVKTVNREVQLQALVDGKKIIVTEASVRCNLQLNNEEGMDFLPNSTIFEEHTRLGYEKLLQKLTFYKEFFSPQWKFLIHTILQCLSAKTTAWNDMVKNLDNAGKFLMYPRKRFSGKETPLFPTMVVQNQAEMGEDEAVYEERDDNLKRAATTATSLDAEQDREFDMENTKTAQAQEITSLKQRVKKLEKKGGSRTHKLKRLYKVGRSVRIVSSDESSLGDQEDASKQGRKINDIDKDVEITLVDETQGSVNEVTLAQALAALKSEKVQEKANVVEEPIESITLTLTLTTTTAPTTITATSTRPKAKGLVIHEEEQATTPIVSS